jgi:hypothetical protein
MQHSPESVNKRCVRPCGALGVPDRRAAAVTLGFTVCLDLTRIHE